ncbi:cytochrome P450 [Marasmius fiardii PR-910]|nr:cytochrome P450 [Marasmius fiardii PR-910]
MGLDSSPLVFLLGALVFSVAIYLNTSKRRQKQILYPPGPVPSGSLIGSLVVIPSKSPWITFAEWGKQYGPLVHLKVPGQHFFIVNNNKVANELLGKRSRIYSDRGFWDVVDSAGWGFSLPALPYSDKWRINRRLHHQSLKAQSIPRFYPVIEQKINFFLRNLIDDPGKFMDHIEVLSGGTVLSAMFGLNVTSVHSRTLELSKTAMRAFDRVLLPQFLFVASCFPFYRFLPTWFPVLGRYKYDLVSSRTSVQNMRELVLEHTVKLLKEGNIKSSLVAELLEVSKTNGGSTEENDRIMNMGLMSYAAGADTMLSSIGTFFLAMVRHSHCQEKASKEIDSVIGDNRLPTFADRSSLPYTEAIYREVTRWHPPLPIAPHSTTEDDFYEGFHIPKGSAVFANIWGMTRDEGVYEKPNEFNPERYFEGDELSDSKNLPAFGFGRRICVGRHFGEAVVWLAIASVLAAFRIEKAKDEQGRIIDTPENYSDGPILFSRPLPFQCSVVPRSAKARALVKGIRTDSD